MNEPVPLAPAVGMSVTGVDKTAGRFNRVGKRAGDKGPALTRHYGTVLQADIRSRARSLFRVTDYDASIQLRNRKTSKGRDITEVYTNDPQGHRLEYGFVGTDSIGRYYAQPPRPHFRPAFDHISAAYTEAIHGLVK